MQELEAFLSGFQEQKLVVAFHDLATGKEFFHNADLSLHPASTIKAAVMLEAFHQAALGEISLDERVPILNSFTSLADGSTFSTYVEDDAETSLYSRIDEPETLRELVRLMIVRSSNLAANILIKLLGADRVTAYLREVGIESITVLRGPEDNRAFALGLNNSATPRGLMQLVQLIAEGNAVSPEASREMKAILLGQEFNEGLPAGLPPGTKVAHKTGWNDHSYHDFGIIYPVEGKPYVLAVMTEGFSTDEMAHSAVAAVSRIVFDASSEDVGWGQPP